MTTLAQAGYITVPTPTVTQTMGQIKPAFCGGLFFTLSVGVGLTLATYVAALFWVYCFKRRFVALGAMGCLLAVVCWLMNVDGINVFPSLYVLLIPTFVFYLTLKTMPREPRGDTFRFGCATHLVSLGILAVFWGTQASQEMFVNVRDSLLLNNPIGMKINRFYYDYTLYAAEAFRPVKKKLIKSCYLDISADPSTYSHVHRILVHRDYLQVPDPDHTDLCIRLNKDTMLFYHGDRHVLTVSTQHFLKAPDKVLVEFSETCDLNRFFRFLTMVCLVLGLPIWLYGVCYLVMLGIVNRFVADRKRAMGMVALFGVLLGSGLCIPVAHLGDALPGRDDIAHFLKSGESYKRIQALKTIEETGQDPLSFSAVWNILEHGSIPEIYWAIRALKDSKHHGALDQLVKFTRSPYTNIACMAYYALGKRKDKRAIPLIIMGIKASDDWYPQGYAYRALRSLGWQQTKKW